MQNRATSAPTVAIIGSGFAGLGMGYYLKQAGIESFTIFEKANEVGGVWRENTYPGAACDVPSHLYSYSFEPHYPWSCRYGHQAEILDYQRHVARKHDLLRHIQFGREVAGADFDEARGVWVIRFTDGSTHEATVLVSAVGQLHRPQIPNIPGRETFQGRAFHSARWEHDYDFKDKTVAVIGTGASAVQFLPIIANQVRKLHVFQRSPGWCIPKFDKPFRSWQRKLLNWFPVLHDMDRWRIFGVIEFLATAMVSKSLISKMATATLGLGAKILMWLQVKDPELRRKLTPDFPIGCKRTLLSNDWLKSLARPNVEVITEDITELTARGIRTSDGRLREVDAIIYSTGFVTTQFLAPMELRGLRGESLRERWKGGTDAYLGVNVSGFPNFFMMYGPNTNLGAGSIIYMLERQSRYIVQCVRELQKRGSAYIDVRPEVQRAYNDELHQRSKQTTYESGCKSWYVDANGRNTNNWVGLMTEYGRRLQMLNPDNYRLVPSGAVADSSQTAKAA